MRRMFLVTIGIAITVSIGSTSCTALRTQNIRPSEDADLWERVQRVGARVAAAADRAFGTRDTAWRFGVVEGDPIGARALPGGTIGIHAPFARTLRDDELAAILAHEVAHVVRHHGWKHIACVGGSCLTTAGAATAGFIIFPWWGGCLALLGVETARALTMSAYERGQETEADEYGLYLLVAAGYPSDAMVRALRKTEPYEWSGGFPTTTVFDGHPSIAERIARVERLRQRYDH